MTEDSPIGVVLLQLGGPDSLESVEPFLYNLFCDPDIIDLPLAFLFRRPLARFIARKRAPKVSRYYARIGGRSPIARLTSRQAAAVERSLRDSLNVRVVVAMRYWHPMTDAAVDRLREEKVRRIILLPLYPQYSRSTTGSSVNEWNRVIRNRWAEAPPAELIEQYCDHPAYVAALVRNIRIALKRVPAADRSRVHLVFSAHGTPMAFVKKGDPYRDQILRTFAAVNHSGDFGIPTTLCYQSKVGPQEWLRPSLADTIERLAGEKATHVIVVPVAFVSDHSETLWEINMEVRAEARRRGIRYYDMSPALNTNPSFITALSDLVMRKVNHA
jgi:ferrochelatase